MRLLITGAGGHGRVVAEAAETSGQWTEIAFLDDRYPELTWSGAWRVVGKFGDLERSRSTYCACVAALGDVNLRLNMLAAAERAGFLVPVIVHARAMLSRYAQLERGSIIAAGGAVNIGAKIAHGCIINTGSTVDHDCRLGYGVHVCPGAHLGGNVVVGPRTWLGIGAVAKQGVSIGSDVTVGAGAVCLDDVPDRAVVFGVPAKERRNE